VTFNNRGTLEVLSGGMRFGSAFTQTAGETRLAGGSLSGSTLTFSGGALVGTGTISASVVNGAVVRPGASPGTLAINGNYTQTASGELQMEIGGLIAGSEFDRLTVSGSASLNGALTVRMIDGFLPKVGNVFPILSYGSRSGAFATTNGLTLPMPVALRGVYGSTGMSLQAFDAGTLDSDNDGAPDWQEIVAGTDPRNINSCFGMELPSTPLDGSGFVIQWRSVTGKLYRVERSTDLTVHPPFTVLQSNIAGEAGTTSYTDTNSVGIGPSFYRVVIDQ